MNVSLIYKICHVRIFGYKYVAISYQILDNQVRSHTCVIHHIQIWSEDLSLNIERFVEKLLCKYTLFLSANIGTEKSTNFLKTLDSPPNFGRRNFAVKQFPYRDPTILE